MNMFGTVVKGIPTETAIDLIKQLEEADFGWVFDCPGIEIEEVEG